MRGRLSGQGRDGEGGAPLQQSDVTRKMGVGLRQTRIFVAIMRRGLCKMEGCICSNSCCISSSGGGSSSNSNDIICCSSCNLANYGGSDNSNRSKGGGGSTNGSRGSGGGDRGW